MSENQKGFDLDLFKEKIEKTSNRFKWGFGLGGAVVLALFGFVIAKILLGAAAVAVSALIAFAAGSAALFAVPEIVQRLKVKRIQWAEDFAAKNPIATQWTLWEKDVKRVNAAEVALDEWAVQVEVFDTENENNKNILTSKDYQSNLKEIEVMRQDVVRQRDDIVAQRQDLQEWERAIKALDAQNRLSDARDKLNKSKLEIAQKDMLDKVRNDASLRAVQEKVARRRMQMEKDAANNRARLKKDDVEQIELSPTETLEIPINQAVKQEIPR